MNSSQDFVEMLEIDDYQKRAERLRDLLEIIQKELDTCMILLGNLDRGVNDPLRKMIRNIDENSSEEKLREISVLVKDWKGALLNLSKLNPDQVEDMLEEKSG